MNPPRQNVRDDGGIQLMLLRQHPRRKSFGGIVRQNLHRRAPNRRPRVHFLVNPMRRAAVRPRARLKRAAMCLQPGKSGSREG